jgi:hypothetical protein
MKSGRAAVFTTPPTSTRSGSYCRAGLKEAYGRAKPFDSIRRNWDDCCAEFQAGTALASKNGWRYLVFTDIDAKSDYIWNADWLLSYRRYGI